MPESAQKILVRACNGDLWLISKATIPEKVHSSDPNLQPHDPGLVEILSTTDTDLADHFGSGNPGVKVGITMVDF